MFKFQILLSRHIFVCLYRPPGQPANLFQEFKDLLENWKLHSEFYIFGYFNLRLDKRTAVTIFVDDILIVTFGRRIHGHWLDLMINRSTYDTIQMLTVSDGLSDHNTVIVDVMFFLNTSTIKTQCVLQTCI